jgi:hypothetical protein
MDSGAGYTILDLKKRIRSEALFKLYIDFLVVPSRLVLVHKGERDDCNSAQNTTQQIPKIITTNLQHYFISGQKHCTTFFND